MTPAAQARRVSARFLDVSSVYAGRGRRNAFDALRLWAAAMVLFSHSFVLVAATEPHFGSESLGFLGVEIFFAISGFLVTKSWDAAPQLKAFFAKRALRILPGLAACVLVSAYVLGLATTTLPASTYLTSPEPFGYALRNLASVASGGLLGSPVYALPGVFGDNPHNASVNGSLWTLPIEVQAYYVVAFLGCLSLTRRALPAIAAAAMLILAAPATAYGMPVVGHVLESRPEAIQLLAIFGVGGMLYLYRDHVPLRLDAAAVLLAALLISLGTPLEKVVTSLTLPYLVLVAAYRLPPALHRLTRHGDISYGLYLLAFPVQQLILLAWPGQLGPYGLFALALPITAVLALLSWRVVERPSLRLKPRPATN
jgi:peptidoglycan/LPS O-acetylase OafA/YrhL